LIESDRAFHLVVVLAAVVATVVCSKVVVVVVVVVVVPLPLAHSNFAPQTDITMTRITTNTTKTIAAVILAFFRHICLFSAVDDFLNLKLRTEVSERVRHAARASHPASFSLSVLSTNSSIFSWRSRTFSMFDTCARA
jgi:hypothetical protein